jgi:hypothetical protein
MLDLKLGGEVMAAVNEAQKRVRPVLCRVFVEA